jgi:3-isopropylmalate/(R)-2-methylmalate dehydratase small subunit
MPGTRLIEGVAVPLPRENIDTDQIISARDLVTTHRRGLGRFLFGGWRSGSPTADAEFPLDQPQYAGASILVAGANFGCGSSREHAVWALQDFGIRCVVAPTFADIFHGNATRSGLLCAVLETNAHEALIQLLRESPGARVEVRLDALEIVVVGRVLPITIDPTQRERIISGMDEVDALLAYREQIDAFRASDRALRPWVYAYGMQQGEDS